MACFVARCVRRERARISTSAAGQSIVRSTTPSSSKMRRDHDVLGSLRPDIARRRCAHCVASMNNGCFGAIAAISASVEFGPTPSKKTPTSAFHRLRYARKSGVFASFPSSVAT